MKRWFLTLLILSLVIIAGCNKQINLFTYYGEFCNEERTSFKDVAGLRVAPKEIKWRYTHPYSDEVYFYTLDAPTIVEDTVYMGADAALNLESGKEKWRNFSQDSPFPFPFSGVVYRDKIFIVAGYPTQYLQAYDKDTGKLIWQSDCIGNPETNTTSGCPLVVNGKVYLAASNVKNYEEKMDAQPAIWVWDSNTGKVLDKIFVEPVAERFAGKYRTLFPVTTMLASDGKEIYGVTKLTNDATHRDYVFCYDTSIKKFTWFEPVEDFKEGYREKIAIDKDVIAISLVGDQWGGKEPQFFIKVYDKSTHKPLWSNITKADREKEPVFMKSFFALRNGKLYAMTMNKRFVCFDSKTGKEIWTFEDKDWQSSWWNNLNGYGNLFIENDITATKDVVYFNVDKAIYALDAETGKLLWRKTLKGYSFNNIMPIEKGLIVTYQDNHSRYDMPQQPAVTELWK